MMPRRSSPRPLSISLLSRCHSRASDPSSIAPVSPPGCVRRRGLMERSRPCMPPSSRCSPARKRRGGDLERGFTPHLSVGQLPRASAAETRSVLAAWERDWRPLLFQVGEVCLISRRGDQPFEVRRRVPLGGRKRSVPGVRDPLASVLSAREALPSREARRVREAVVGRLKELCTRLGVELHPYGSYLLGTDTAASDVDAVAMGPASLSREDFAQALEDLLSERPPRRACASWPTPPCNW